MKPVLITGADGFIGSHLVEKLVTGGTNVRALVHYNSFAKSGWLDHICPKVKAEVEIVRGDIRDPFLVDDAVSNCSSVVHLAALIAIPYSYRAPHSYVSTNIVGTLNLLQAALKQNVDHFVHTSTSEVYGTAQYVPICEKHPLQPQSPYSASKIAADSMAQSFFSSFSLPVTIIRPFNTYGPRQSTRAVIPTVISQIMVGNRKIKLGAIHPTRDFNYIDDTVSGFVATLNKPSIAGEVVNIGSNFEISVKDTALMIADLMNVEIEIMSEKSRLRPSKSEVERLLADNTKAKKLLSWSPAHANEKGLRLGLKKTIEWFTEPANTSLYQLDGYTI